MRVSIELQPCLKNKSGIGIYTFELTKRLQNKENMEFTGNVFNFFNRNDISDTENELNIKLDKCTLFPYGVYRRIWRYIPIKYNWIFKNTDIYQFFNFIVPTNISGKVVTTIHDLTYILYPETMDEKNRMRLEKDMVKTIKRADYFLTISENSKRDIVNMLNIPESKISVIYPGVDEVYRIRYRKDEIDKVKKKYNIKGKYLLYLGTLEPRKNIDTIIKAYSEFIKSNNEDIKLVLAGKKGWLYENIFALVSQLNIEDKVVFTDYIDEDEKPLLYQGAEVFLFPSLYEGFGMPVAEAMASGTPVITSDSSSLPEVAGNAAIITEAHNFKKISESINEILNNDELRESMISKGLKQSEKFNWDKSAEKLTKIYMSLYNQ